MDFHIRGKVACPGGSPTALILSIAAMGRLLAFAVIGGCRLSGSNNAYCRRSSIYEQTIRDDKFERPVIENRYSHFVPTLVTRHPAH
jgi:hypothetical protein